MNTAATTLSRSATGSTGPRDLVPVLAGWLALALGAGIGGGFLATDGLPALAMPAAIVTPIALFVLAYAASAGFRDRVLCVDTRVLVLIHTWRMVGLGFLMMYTFGLLPGIFAFPAGIGDAAAAAWALVVGIGLYGGYRVSRRQLLAWNGFGLLDFVIAVLIGTLSRYGFLDGLSGGVTTAVMGEFPMVLIPTFVVPLLVITHLIVFLQVRNDRALGIRERGA